MTNLRPKAPPALSEPVATVRLPQGARVWRVHHRDWEANALNSTPQPHRESGGRFDSISDPVDYSYTYVARSINGSIAETIGRELPDTSKPQLVPKWRVKDRLLSQMLVSEDIFVATLHGPTLNAIGAGAWLTTCDPYEYVITREWARAIINAPNQPTGIEYRGRLDTDEVSYMLTGIPGANDHRSLQPIGTAIPLDSHEGMELVNEVLAPHGAQLA